MELWSIGCSIQELVLEYYWINNPVLISDGWQTRRPTVKKACWGVAMIINLALTLTLHFQPKNEDYSYLKCLISSDFVANLLQMLCER